MPPKPIHIGFIYLFSKSKTDLLNFLKGNKVCQIAANLPDRKEWRNIIVVASTQMAIIRKAKTAWDENIVDSFF